MNDFTNDICTAIMRLRHAFMKHHLEPPMAIELKSHDDVNQMKAEMDTGMIMFNAEFGLGPEVVANIMGVEIRAPAKFRPNRKGGFSVE